VMAISTSITINNRMEMSYHQIVTFDVVLSIRILESVELYRPVLWLKLMVLPNVVPPLMLF